MMPARPLSPRLPAVRLARPGVAAALILACAGCGRPQSQAPQPTEVTVAPVLQRDVPVTQEWVASLSGFVDAQIRAQVTGYLLRQDYKEGSEVKAGDLLFEIDPRPFQAALDQARAQLAAAQAQYGEAEKNMTRYAPLAKEQAISQQEYDDAVQADLGAKAQVAGGQAAVEKAELDLGFTRITSPISGVAGLIQAQVGDLVGPGTGPLTEVSTLNPMKVYFSISEDTYLSLARKHPGTAGFPKDVPLQLILADGSVYPQAGTFYAADRQINPGTGTLEIAALFPNPGNLLRPGEYGRVRAQVQTIPGALLVPQQALNELQGGTQVATVDASNRAHIQSVTIGPQVGGLVVVTSGLKAGQRVIIEGFQKVREGSPVRAQPAQPAP